MTPTSTFHFSDCDEADPQFSLSSCVTPVRRLAGDQMVNLSSWTNVLEEVLSWLLEAEDHLLSLNSLGQKQLETVKSRFYNHEDFMLELRSHQSAVGEVSPTGRIQKLIFYFNKICLQQLGWLGDLK